MMQAYTPKPLPLDFDIESKQVLKKAALAHKELAKLEGVIQTSKETVCLIEEIRALMQYTKVRLRRKMPKIYSKDLLEILFKHPYTKIEFLVDGLGVSRQTASTYLKKIETLGILREMKLGRSKYFINMELFELLRKGGEMEGCV